MRTVLPVYKNIVSACPGPLTIFSRFEASEGSAGSLGFLIPILLRFDKRQKESHEVLSPFSH